MPERKDYREELTAKLIEQLEAGTAPWQKPWDGRSRLPYNATTEKPYRGVNSLYLSSVGIVRGYADPRWATYAQASKKQWQVRKGEKGVGIEYWKRSESHALKDEHGEPVRGGDGKALTREIPLTRPRVFYATVFNLQQMDGAPALSTTERSYAWDPLERAEQILKSSGARILYDQGDRAYYSPVRDEIHLPEREQFKDSAAFYGVGLHELGHWSGHSSRLNRDLSGAFGSPSYAREELRAEISSYFLADQTGIPHDPTRHASYVKSWVRALTDDKNEIFRASRDAETITDYVISLDRARDTAAPENETTAAPAQRPARALAFDQLPESEAIAQHPELKSAYAAMRAFRSGVAERFPDDPFSRDQHIAKARADILAKLDAGATPRDVQVVRAEQGPRALTVRSPGLER